MKLKLTTFSLFRFLSENLSNPVTYKYNLLHILRYWLKGFNSEHIALYNLKENDYRNFLNDACKYKVTLWTNKNVWPVLHDKLYFDSFMRGKLPTIPVLFFISNGTFNAVQEGYNKAVFIEKVKEGQSFVIKPIQGGMGNGLYFIRNGNDHLTVNGKEMELTGLESMLGELDYHACYPFVNQHPVLQEIYDKTVNTLRVTSYINNEGKPKIFGAVLRVGTIKTIPVDNFGQGGIALLIDQKKGIVIKAISRDDRGEQQVIDHHPDSHKKLSGFSIPFWHDIQKTIIDFHITYPSFDFVGWDVLIGEQGFYIIEGNHNPGTKQLFLLKNFSDDIEFREFFKFRNIIN